MLMILIQNSSFHIQQIVFQSVEKKKEIHMI